MPTELSKKKCIPCEGGVPPLTKSEIRTLMQQVKGWALSKDGWLVQEYEFEDFVGAKAFVDKVSELAEEEGHHPNIYIYSWNKLRLELYTHSINGLAESDFILAAKINEL